MGLAIDAVKMSKSMDVIVIASGDGDYISLVTYVQNTTSCRVEGIAFGESTSGKLIETLDDFIDLSSNRRKFLL